MAALHASEQTHQSVLPQQAALESASADNPGVGTKRGADAIPTMAAGVQHGRGERPRPVRRGVSRHGPTVAQAEGPVPGSDPSELAVARPRHARVLVLDRHSCPLMPCHPARARELLAKRRARIHRRYPFTIRLVDRLVENSEVNGVVVKIDPGSRSTGISVARVTEDGSVHGLFGIQVEHRGRQVHRKMHARSALRRARRCRKLRYRAPRFDNRRRPKGWLAPSLRHRVEGTMTWVNRLRRVAPVVGLELELVRFDTQALQNPEIGGVEYQHGSLHGFEVREYLLAKWSRRCAYCDAENTPLNVEHIQSKSKGGSDRVSNLTLACVPCNHRKGSRDVREFVTDPQRRAWIVAQAKAPLQDAAAVNATRWALYRAVQATGVVVQAWTGGRTKWNRTRHGLAKSHTLDALCVGEIARVSTYPWRVLIATSWGRGSYARTRSDAYGFPRAVLSRRKRHYRFQTGDHVKAVVPRGRHAGVHAGRVTVRATGSFDVTTSNGVTRQGIGHKRCQQLARADGWGYREQPEAGALDSASSHREGWGVSTQHNTHQHEAR